MQFSEERKWQRNEVTNWKVELFEYLRSSPFSLVTGEVTGEVHRLLGVVKGEMKRQEIQAALGLKHEDHFRKAYLVPALKAGLIEMTNPEKPRSSKQRYRITPLGAAVLKKYRKVGL